MHGDCGASFSRVSGSAASATRSDAGLVCEVCMGATVALLGQFDRVHLPTNRDTRGALAYRRR
jgi:hypothetical protein